MMQPFALPNACRGLACALMLTVMTNPLMSRPLRGAEFRSIFDGRSLEGWRTVPENSASDWSVHNGVIVGAGSADRLSYLVWTGNERLKDFELKFQYRTPTDGNTGVEIRSQKDNSGKRPFEGYHADLGHVGIGDNILGAWDFHFAKRKEHPCPRGTRLVIGPDGRSAQSSKLKNAIQVAEIHKRGWNRVRIIAEGNRFQFFINGKLASAFVDNADKGQLHHGSIGLQIHDKGMRVEFKDIQLKVLD